MTLDLAEAYTFKTQHLRSAALTGDEDAVLVGNVFDNASSPIARLCDSGLA